VALLAVFTFVVPENQVASQQVSSLGYSAEEVLLDQTSSLDETSDNQTLTTIYGEDEPSR